jgi:hypothetical protein
VIEILMKVMDALEAAGVKFINEGRPAPVVGEVTGCGSEAPEFC